MSRSDAYIRVTCDRCWKYEEEYQLTALATGAYDERNVGDELERYGWRVEDGQEICPNCVEEEESKEEES